MIHLLYIGATYRKTPVEIRERMVLSEETLHRQVAGLVGRQGIVELYPLSTCNRTEIYVVHGEDGQPAEAVRSLLVELSGGAFVPGQHADELADLDAANHLLEVASGLDSMVMGEPQILGQVKEAYEKARHAKLLGTVLDRLLQTAFKAGKRARDETDIGMGAVSVSFAAVELARKIFGHLEHKVATLIGVGEMGTLCAKHLQSAGIHKLFLVNRTFERSEELARELEGQPVPIEELYATLARSDIVISSTAAPGFVIHAEPLRAQVLRPAGRVPAGRHRHPARHRAGGRRPARRVPVRHRRPDRHRRHEHQEAPTGGREGPPPPRRGTPDLHAVARVPGRQAHHRRPAGEVRGHPAGGARAATET